MKNTYLKYPFWVTEQEKVFGILDRYAERHVLCKSAGGREIPYYTLGEKPDYHSQANYSSACGAGNPGFYADKKGKRPAYMLIGATHGMETEGIMAVTNLVSLIGTGRDLAGEERPSLVESYLKSDCRLVIVPIYNLDGRSRCELDSMLDEPMRNLRYYSQGTWKDGSLCGWPGCKAVHPIKDAVDYLGAYYNDDGVNLMHDNFFCPMAKETAALMKLCSDEAPDIVIGLHGGDNTTNVLLQPSYTPDYIRQAVWKLAKETERIAAGFGLTCRIAEPRKTVESYPPPPFNLTSAIHHVCGAVSSTYESNQGLTEDNSFSAEDILLHHYALFEAIFRTKAGVKQQG